MLIAWLFMPARTNQTYRHAHAHVPIRRARMNITSQCCTCALIFHAGSHYIILVSFRRNIILGYNLYDSNIYDYCMMRTHTIIPVRTRNAHMRFPRIHTPPLLGIRIRSTDIHAIHARIVCAHTAYILIIHTTLYYIIIYAIWVWFDES